MDEVSAKFYKSEEKPKALLENLHEKRIAYLETKEKEIEKRVKVLERVAVSVKKHEAITFPNEPKFFETSLKKIESIEGYKISLPSQPENDYPESSSETLQLKMKRIIEAFEKNSDKTNYWKSLDEILKITDYDLTQIKEVFKNSELRSFLGSFVKNKYDEITTRELYSKYTPFLTKFIHAFEGKID